MVGVVLLLVFATGLLEKRGRPKQLCDNSLCVTAPVGWHVKTNYGGTSTQLVMAPFSLPEGEGSPPTPAGKFQILISNYWPYRFGWPRRKVVSISGHDIKRTTQSNSPSSAHRLTYFRGHSLEVWVSFGDPDPPSDQIESVNRILLTIHRAPPPKLTR